MRTAPPAPEEQGREVPPSGGRKDHRLPRSLRFALAGNFILRVAGPTTSLLLTLYLADINEREYPIGAFAVGALTAAFYLTELLGAPFFGALGDRRGRRGLLLAGPLIAAAALGLTALTTVLAVLLVTRLMEGVSTAATVPTILGQLSEETADDAVLRGRVLSVFEVTTALGTLVGTATGTAVWLALGRGGFLLVALGYLLAAGLFLPSRDRRDGVARARSGQQSWRESLATIRGQRALLRFFPAWLSLSAITSLWFTHALYQMRVARPEFAAQYLSGRFAENQRGLALVLLAYALTFSAGILIWGYAGLRRLHEVWIMRVSLGAMLAVCAVLWILNHSGDNGGLRGAALTLFTVLLLVESGFAPAAVAYLARLSGQVSTDRGLVMGLYTVVTGGGALLGNSLGAPFAELGAIDGILLATVLLAGFSLALLFRLDSDER